MIQLPVGVSANERVLKPGEFARLRYKNEEKELTDRQVLVMAYEEEKRLVHALDLDKFSDQNLINVGREMTEMSNNQEEFQIRLEENDEVFIEIDDDEIEQWYERHYSADRFNENPYRTFREDRIRNLRMSQVAQIV